MTQPSDDLHETDDMCPTMAALKALGFLNQLPEFARNNLGFQMGSFELSAQEMVNLSMVPIVQISGVLQTPSVLAVIDLELRQGLKKPEEAAAWLVFGLQSYKRDLGLLPVWWAIGEASLHLHPVVKQRRRAKERAVTRTNSPHCVLDIDHAQLFRRQLRHALSQLSDSTDATMTFDGKLLSIEVAGKLVSVLAHGVAWPHAVRWGVTNETKLPARFKAPQVQIRYFDGQWDFENCRYTAEEVLD